MILMMLFIEYIIIITDNQVIGILENIIINKYLYLIYSALNENGKSTLFLMSAELNNNSLVNKKIIFEAVAYRRVPIHLGAKIDFLSDIISDNLRK